MTAATPDLTPTPLLLSRRVGEHHDVDDFRRRPGRPCLRSGPGLPAGELGPLGFPVQLGGGRVLHSGRRLWLRAVAWLLLLCFLTAAAYGLLTGGAFGPEASVFALVLVGAVAVAALSLAGRAGRLRVEPASTSPSGPGLR